MLITRSMFEETLQHLCSVKKLSLDTETTGLRPFHYSQPFAIIISDGEKAYYFNFFAYLDLTPNEVMGKEQMVALNERLFADPDRLWYMHNAKFDMHQLGQARGTRFAGEIFCTMAQGRVAYNEHMSYSLSESLKRIGLEKSSAVDEYIKEHDLWDWKEVPGKDKRERVEYYYRVPLEVMQPYAEQDAIMTYRLGEHLQSEIKRYSGTPKIPPLSNVMEGEKRLTKVLYDMERLGLQVDMDFTRRAIEHEEGRAREAAEKFKEATGKSFKTSGKLFAEVFADQKDRWKYTEKGQPSFTSDVLEGLEGEVAKYILAYRDAKSRSDFLNGFNYFTDNERRIHPTLNQGGTVTGRTAGNSPNFQNLTKDEKYEGEFPIRKAIIPAEEFCLVAIDYDQMEYRLMLEYSKDMPLIDAVNGGLDVHQATADLMGVTRTQAKTINFMLLYGGGVQKLADALSIPFEEAKRLKALYFSKLPGVAAFSKNVAFVAEGRGYIINWMGRICHFPDPNYSYKAPNYLIQGGCADVAKKAMCDLHAYLTGKKSRLILNVHDECLFEVHESELHIVPDLKRIMEEAYPYKYLKLSAGASYSWKSWGEMDECEAGDGVPSHGSGVPKEAPTDSLLCSPASSDPGDA